MSEPMPRHPASFTVEVSEVGNLYYFAPADRAPGPYLKQIHVNAVVDIAADGTLGGVELIDWMPPPFVSEYPTADPVAVGQAFRGMTDLLEDVFSTAKENGFEPGCDLAEWLNERLSHASNGYSDADALRDLQDAIQQSASLSDFMAVKKTVEAIRQSEADQ